jgi:hypothetical protein
MALKLQTSSVQSNSETPTPRLRLAYSAPEPNTSVIEELRRLTMSATKTLPFVKLRANDQPWLHPESYWHVKSTGKRTTDIALGRSYARKALVAMKADCNTRLIALILEDIFHDTRTRAGKKGGGRGPCAIAVGFLDEVSHTVAAKL